MSGFPELYPSLHQLGLTSSLLLAVAEDSDHGSDLEGLHISTVTNQNIIELYKFMNRNFTCTFYTFWRWVASLLGDRWPKSAFPTVKSMRQSVLRLNSKLANIKKLPNSDKKVTMLSQFFNEEYSLPKIFMARGEVVHLSDDSSSCSSCAENDILKSQNASLCQKLSALRSERENFDKMLRQKIYSTHRNGQKKLKRREQIIQKQQKLVKDGKKIIGDLQRKVVQVEGQMGSLRVQIDRLRHRAAYWKKKCNNIESASSEEIIHVLASKEACQSQLQDEVQHLEHENMELRDMVQEIMSEANEKIVTFDGGKYTDDVRACCYELLSLNVGVRNVKAVIESVLKNIAHRQADRLPKRTALCDMMLECLTVAQAQLGEQLSQDDGAHYTLQSDGTTKYGQHFSTFDIATTEDTFALGLRHVFTGSAQNTLETLLEILEDLDVVQKELGQPGVSSTIIAKMKNTMSDRHAAEKLFSTILAEYRATILPDVVSGWNQMTDGEQEQLTRMNNFFCGLHFLVGLADAAEETLKLWESTIEDESVQVQGKSSGTQTLIRCACKAFHHRGSQQAGCSTHFRTYLRRKGVCKIPIASFVGNRFNILFYDAAGIYYLKSHMIAYLTNSHGPVLNRLLQSVLKDLKCPYFIAGCRALGIIDKLVSGPFWRYLQTSSVSILSMSEVYTKMRDRFAKWSDDAQTVLENEELLFPDHTSSHDDVATCLYQPTEDDHLVLELLQLLFKSFMLTIERLLVDHLPGGEFHSVSNPDIIAETKSVPKTNVTPERDFAIFDRMISQKPNASHIALESMILFSQNKTSQWLHSKTPEEKERLLHAARTLTKAHRKNFKKRREEIESKRLEALMQKERELSQKRDKELKEKEDLTLRIQKYGLWTNHLEVNHKLSDLKNKKAKVDALKVQINFRRKVLNQTHPEKQVFQFSHNRQAFTVEKLAQNLCKLLPSEAGPQCVPSADEILKDPELMLYRRIEHLFSCNGDEVWYKGTVLSYNKVDSEFRVAYDNEDEVYSFPLLEDLRKGELKIVL